MIHQFMMENIELLVGMFLGFVLAILLFVIYQICTYNHSTTALELIEEDEDGSQLVECWTCGGQTTIPAGVKPMRYCPGCGRAIEGKIIKPLFTFTVTGDNNDIRTDSKDTE